MHARHRDKSRADTRDDSTAGDGNEPATTEDDTSATVVPIFCDEDTNVDLGPDSAPVTVTVDAAALAALARELVGVGEQLALTRRELDVARSRIAALEERFARLTPP